MNFELISIDEIDKKAWSDFVSSHSLGSIFQTPQMYEIYERTKNYRPLLVAVADARGNIQGLTVSVIQREFGGPIGELTTRCVTWGAPLISEKLAKNGQFESLTQMIEAQDRLTKRKAIYMEYRNRWDTGAFSKVFDDHGYSYEEELEILIDLKKTEESLWTDLTKSRRKGINRAKKENYEFFEFPGAESFEQIYDLIEETYDNVKVPLADITFFETAREILFPKEMLKVFCVKNKTEILAARLELIYNGIMFDWYAGSNELGKSMYANEYLVWNMLIWGHEKGIKTFAFGGAGKPDEDYGPREFKRRFGGKTVNYGRYKKVYKKVKMKIAETGLKIMKKVK